MEKDKQQELLQDTLNNDEGYRIGDMIYDRNGNFLGIIEEK